jgi:hypothetical protein
MIYVTTCQRCKKTHVIWKDIYGDIVKRQMCRCYWTWNIFVSICCVTILIAICYYGGVGK